MCIANSNYSNSYTCDGNSGQVSGRGLFNANTADEFSGCNSSGWKHSAGGSSPSVCSPSDYVSVYFK